MTTRLNYAEQLEEDAYQAARKRLIRAAEGTRSEDRLDGWLARLELIHRTNMGLAHQWSQPAAPVGRMQKPLDGTDVTSVAVNTIAKERAAEAQEELS